MYEAKQAIIPPGKNDFYFFSIGIGALDKLQWKWSAFLLSRGKEWSKNEDFKALLRQLL